MNGDGGTSNDLIYIPKDVSEMNFQQYTASGTGGKTFTAADQAAAFEAFIQQSDYLRNNRGKYAERGAVFLPMVYNADVSVTQDLFTNVAGKKNTIQLRLDILNFGNLLKDTWGQGYTFTRTSILVPAGADTQGRAQYRFSNVSPTELLSTPFQRTANLGDVWRMQLGLRYIFN
jgi:hypothetical protein